MRILSMQGAAIGLVLGLGAPTPHPAAGAVLSAQDEILLELQDAGAILSTSDEALLALQEPGAGKSAAEAERSAWERARRELNKPRYDQAAELFEAFAEDFPESPHVAEAHYWQAYSRYQVGLSEQDSDELETARDLLQDFGRHYPKHELRDESLALLDRVRAALAKLGSLEDREEILREFEDDKKAGAKNKGGCDDEIRMTAIQSLLQMDPRRAMPILEKVLKNRNECPELREQALHVVSQNGGSESLRLILDVAKNDPDPDVREKAVFWLSQMPGEESFDAIVGFLNDSTEPKLQEQAVFALSQHQSARSAAILRDVASNKRYSTDVREKAIFWLSQSDPGESVGFLTKLYADLDDPDLREKVIFSISQSQSPEAEAWLRARAMDTKEEIDVRKNALFWLSNNGLLSCDDMLKLYSTFAEREMREQILFGLSQLHEDCAVDALIRIVRTEKDEELVEKAVFWLGQTGDDKAYQFLEELIDKGRGGQR